MKYPFCGFTQEQLQPLARKARAALDLAPRDRVLMDARGNFTSDEDAAVIWWVPNPEAMQGASHVAVDRVYAIDWCRMREETRPKLDLTFEYAGELPKPKPFFRSDWFYPSAAGMWPVD